MPEQDDDNAYLEDIYHPTRELVQQVEEWSQECLGIKEKDSAWEAQVATIIFHLSNENAAYVDKKDAEVRARKARELDANNWRAIYILAQTTESLLESIQLLESLIDRLTNDSEWLGEGDHKVTLAAIMISLGDRLWESSPKPEAAIAMYSKSLKIGRAEHMVETYYSILKRYRERMLWSAVVSFLDDWLSCADDTDDGGYLMAPPDLDSLHTFVFQVLVPAFQDTGRWDILDTLYEKAMAREMDPWDRCLNRYYYGVTFGYREGKQDSALPVWEKLLLEEVDPFEVRIKSLAINSILGLMVPFFLTKAFMTDGIEGTLVPVKEYCDKIEAFYRDFSTWADQDSNALMAFARYFHLRGDDTQSKKLLKEIVVQRLELLSDDELDNDSRSLWDLGQVFAVMDDMKNALAAWELQAQSIQAMHELQLKADSIKKAEEGADSPAKSAEGEVTEGNATEESNVVETRDKLEDGGKDASNGQEETEESPSSNQDRDSDEADTPPDSITPSAPDPKEGENPIEQKIPERRGVAGCDNCGRQFAFASEMWTCADEVGMIQFDNDCYKLLKDGALDTSGLCDKNHRHYYVGKRDDEKMARIPHGSVLMGDEVITFDAWKHRVRAAYVDFVNPTPAMSQLGVALG